MTLPKTDPELIFTAVPGGYQVDLIDHSTSTWPLLRLHTSPTGNVTTCVDRQRGEIELSMQENLHADLLSSVDLFADAFTTLARRLREQGPAPLGALLNVLHETEGEDILAPAFALEGDPRDTACEVVPTAPLEQRRAGIGGLDPRLILMDDEEDASLNGEPRSLRLITRELHLETPHETEDATVYHLTGLLWPPGVTGPDSAVVTYPRTQPFGYSGVLALAAQGGVSPITGTVTRLDVSLGRVVSRILDTGERFTAEQVLLAAEQIGEDSTPREFFRVIDRMAGV